MAGKVGAIVKPAAAPTPASAAVPGGYVPPTCAAVRAEPSPEGALTTFHNNFPAALEDQKLVERVTLDDRALRAISAYLACLAQRTNYEPDVAETALWLYASKRHGSRARAQLRALTMVPGDDGAAAKEFARQIEDYLAADR